MAKPFKVDISVLGRFHAFDLAQQLHKHGHLNRLISSYPAFVGERYGVPASHFQSFIFWELFRRFLPKAKPLYQSFWNEQFFVSDGYDRSIAKWLQPGADIFVGWSGSSLHSLRAAKKLGMKTILERGSAHIETQKQILTEEYSRQGSLFFEIHPKILEKELQEYQEADFISVPSQFAVQSFLEHGFPRSKLIHVPYGVSLEHFSAQENRDRSRFRVIFCGTASLQKGTHYLLQAFHELANPDMELWLVGTVRGEMLPFLRKYGNGQVKVFGKLPQSELKNYYSQCSVFCLPSLQEGFAMVILQAMACGLPVITTTNTGANDIMREGKDGFIIPIRNVEKLKEKILFFYQNQNAVIEMGANAVKQVSHLFTWKDYGEKMISEYSRILG